MKKDCFGSLARSLTKDGVSVNVVALVVEDVSWKKGPDGFRTEIDEAGGGIRTHSICGTRTRSN